AEVGGWGISIGTTAARRASPAVDVAAGGGAGPTVWSGDAMGDGPIGVPGGAAAGGLSVAAAKGRCGWADESGAPAGEAAVGEGDDATALAPPGLRRISPPWTASVAPPTNATTIANTASSWRCVRRRLLRGPSTDGWTDRTAPA